MKNFCIEYAKHSALNLGQTLQGLRYFYSHPFFDDKAERGSFKHFRFSFALRAKTVMNDFFYTLIPPHWHHTPAEVQSLRNIPLLTLFEAGLEPWKFKDESLARRVLTGDEDRRWDPRCDDMRAAERRRP